MRIRQTYARVPVPADIIFMKLAFYSGVIAACVLLTGTLRADMMSFANSANITIRDGNSASPYPSSITVTGMSGTVSKVTVRLDRLSHSQTSDMDMLLVGPTGAKLVLFSDAGGSNSIASLTIVLDDAATFMLPTGFLSSGTFKPTDYGEVADTFLSPAPAIAFTSDSAGPAGVSTLTAKFAGTVPNGTWSLYIMDDTTNGLGGSVAGGWGLTLTTVGSLPPQPLLTNAVVNAAGQFQFGFNGISNASYSVLISTNLVNWSVVGTASNISAGMFRYIDPQPRTNAVRYYRVSSP